jgi:ubiquitin-conjugating enzyme E2 Q
MSLNEIVNCPGKFISSNPFVVVQHVDWIQCRYILVQVSQDKTVPSSAPASVTPAFGAPASSKMPPAQTPLAKTPFGKPSLGQSTPSNAKVNETR